MEHISKSLRKLEESLNLTPSETQEEYILTPEEEALIVESAIAHEKKAMAWRMRHASANEFQVESRLKHTDFEKLIDKDRLFKEANSAKHQELWHRERRQKDYEAQISRQKDLATRCTAKYMFRLLSAGCRAQTGNKLKVDDNTGPLIKVLCFFFSNDPRFESEFGYSFSKGLILRGKCGLGKTFLVDLLKENELKPVFIKSMLDIAEEVKDEGGFTPPLGKIIYLDDVGSEEPVVNHYGTRINWFKTFMETYYLKGLPFNRLIFSTNNSFQQLEEKYGFRVRSRFKQMFNVVDVTGEDLRK